MSRPPRYKLALFDFDGTLADTVPWFMARAGEIAERFRLEKLEDAQLEALRSDGSANLLRHLNVPAWKLPLIASHVRKLAEAEAEKMRLFPGVEALLQNLSTAGVRVAMVSSNAEASIVRILGPANVARIDYFECGASLFGKKRKFRRVLKRSGFSAAETLCIGDETRDAEAAREAGIDFGAATWGFARAGAFRPHRPRYVFDEIGAIARLFCGEG